MALLDLSAAPAAGCRQKTVEAICAQPEFAKAIRELCPKGLGRNKQVVADLIGSGRFGTLTALYRLKNRM